MSLAQFIRILIARRWMIITAVGASLFGAMLVVLVVPPRYTASTRVMLDIVKPDPVTGEVLGNQFLRAYTKTQTELIRDYKVTGPIVDELGWTRDPEMMARYDIAGDPATARRRMAQVIIDNTAAQLIDGSNILQISYTGYSPEAAKTVADMLRRSYIDAALALKRESASETADWYQVQTDKARRLLAIAEDRKAKFERTHGLILQPDKSDVDSIRLAALSGQQAAPAVASAGPAVMPPSANAAQLAQLDAQIAQARQTMGPNHPSLREAMQRRALLAAQVGQERAAADAALAAARGAAGASNAAASANQRALGEQRARVLANRDKLGTLRQLQDEVDLRRDQYVKASAKLADLRLQGDVSEAGLTVLGNAVAPENAAFPNIPLLLVGGLGLGFALGVLTALLTELLNRRVRSGSDMESAAKDIPLLAIVTSTHSKPRRSWFKAIRPRIQLPRREEAIAV